MPSGTTLFASNCTRNIILSRANCVKLHACMLLLRVFLTNQLTVFFLVSEYIVMRGDGRRVHLVPWNLSQIRVLFGRRPQSISLSSSYPPLRLNISDSCILTWTGELLLFNEVLIRESINLWGETSWRLDHSDAKLVEPIHLETLCWLHGLVYLIKANIWLICTRTFKL
jgi:hypothetical protein